MPLPLKTMLRFAEKVMDKDSDIGYQLSCHSLVLVGRLVFFTKILLISITHARSQDFHIGGIYGVITHSSTLDFLYKCSFILCSIFLRYLHSQVVSNYIFVDPSLISVGHNTQEVRAWNLCSGLMASKQNQNSFWLLLNPSK